MFWAPTMIFKTIPLVFGSSKATPKHPVLLENKSHLARLWWEPPEWWPRHWSASSGFGWSLLNVSQINKCLFWQWWETWDAKSGWSGGRLVVGPLSLSWRGNAFQLESKNSSAARRPAECHLILREDRSMLAASLHLNCIWTALITTLQINASLPTLLSFEHTCHLGRDS